MTGGTGEASLTSQIASLTCQIGKKLQGDVSADWLSCSIFKVPNHLRQISEKAYEPQVISIGPYHHGQGQLTKMEGYKIFYLKMLLERRPEISLEEYVKALKVKEEEARKFYSEPFDQISGEKFVEMMLLDGCFIVELIRKSATEELRLENDHLLTHLILGRVMLDLLLVENQLPFFILSELFNMTVMPNDEEKDFMDIAIKFFSEMMPGSLGRPENRGIKHLLGLLHDSCQAPNSPDCPEVRISCSPERVTRSTSSRASAASESFSPLNSEMNEEKNGKWQFIRSATELREAGIDFKKIKGRLFDIEFDENGVMSIPALSINDNTESILRNLVAYEQCFKGASSKCFTDYLTFMDCLISTTKDVELLRHRGVIDNWLGDDEVVATIFNKLCDSVLIYEEDFSYAETFNKVNKHCKRKWNRWKAYLWHNYFNNPWVGISVFAAVILLLLTVLQSVYSVLSFHIK